VFSFFDLPTALAIAEHTRQTSDEAALVWQLTGVPVLSSHPTGADAAPLLIFDDRWLARRWPDLTVADVAALPDFQPHYTCEKLPLSGPQEQLTALRDGHADGWTLLGVDVDEFDVTWFLPRSRRKRDPRRQLLHRDRDLPHPLLRALNTARFTVRNFPPGGDGWSATRRGERYHVHVDVTPAQIGLRATGHGDRPHWHTSLRGDTPPDIAAAIAIALTQIPDSDTATEDTPSSIPPM